MELAAITKKVDARQRRDEVTDDTVDEIFPAGVAGQVGKGQHRERGLVRQRQRFWRRGGCCGRQRQLIADAWHRRDGTRADQLAQSCDLDREVAFLDIQIGPDVFQKFRLGHNPACVRVEVGQHVKSARANDPI